MWGKKIVHDNYACISSVNMQLICGYIEKTWFLNPSNLADMDAAVVVYVRKICGKAGQYPWMSHEYARFV